MKQFKFFRGTKSGRLNVLDVESRSTASHVDIGHTRFTFAELREPNIERGDTVSEPIRLFNPVTIRVRPTFLTRVKIFGQKVKLVIKETWRIEPVGLVIAIMLGLLISVIGIAKILGL